MLARKAPAHYEEATDFLTKVTRKGNVREVVLDLKRRRPPTVLCGYSNFSFSFLTIIFILARARMHRARFPSWRPGTTFNVSTRSIRNCAAFHDRQHAVLGFVGQHHEAHARLSLPTLLLGLRARGTVG